MGVRKEMLTRDGGIVADEEESRPLNSSTYSAVPIRTKVHTVYRKAEWNNAQKYWGIENNFSMLFLFPFCLSLYP